MSAPVAVLFSGGLDSAVMLAMAAVTDPVQPIYVRAGFAWEEHELEAARALLAAMPSRHRLLPLVTLTVDMRDIFPPSHWAVCGDAPGYDTPDEDVYLEGRNIILLSKAAVFMPRVGITRVQIGPLAGNPFPDATPEFFDAMQRALSIGVAAPIVIEAPLAQMHKGDVIRRGAGLGIPFHLTLSCMQPVGGRHCGRCSKCREREQGFREAGVPNPS